MNAKPFNPSVFVIAALALAATSLIPTRTQANLLTNGSFEDTIHFVDNIGQHTMKVSVADSTTMPGWTVAGSHGIGLDRTGQSVRRLRACR